MVKLLKLDDFRARVSKSTLTKDEGVRREVNSTIEVRQDRVVRFVFSDGSIDRYGDRVSPTGWQLGNFLNNPVALYGHDPNKVENVIGKVVKIFVEDGKLIGDIEFMEAGINPLAETIFQMVKNGFLNAVSVGFMPLKWRTATEKNRSGGIDFIEQELMEISVVPLPANSNALVMARSANISGFHLLWAKSLTESYPSLPPITVNEDGSLTFPPDWVGELNKMTGKSAPAPQRPVIKSMWHIGWLAGLLADLDWLEDCIEWEAEVEGDGSDLSARLHEVLVTLGGILIDLTVEEVSEMIGDEEAESGEEEVSLSSPSAKLLALSKLARQKDGVAPAILSALRSHEAGHRVTFSVDRGEAQPLMKAGRVLSKANETDLASARDLITGVLNQVAQEQEESSIEDDTADKAAETDRRRRIATGLRLLASAP